MTGTYGFLTMATLAVLIAGQCLAAPRQATVVANAGGGTIQKPARDAARLSQELLGLGFDVRRLTETSAAEAPSGPPAQVAVLYFAGQTQVQEGRTMLLGPAGPIDVADAAMALRDHGAAQVVAIVDGCAAGAGGETAPLTGDPAVLMAMSPAPGKSCSDPEAAGFGDRVIGAFRAPGQPLAAALRRAGIAGFGGEKVDFVPRPGGGGAGAAGDMDQPIVVGAAILPLSVSTESMLIGRVSPPAANPATPVPPPPPPPPPPPGNAATGDAQVIPAGAPASLAALPTRPGFPPPSVILGETETPPAPEEFAALPSVTPLGVPVAERRRIRAEDPARFTNLLSAGAFDPAADRLAEAVQTELARMECYDTQVDGIWGNGSRRAVTRYYAASGVASVGTEPTTQLFRALITRDDVICPPQPAVQRNPPAATTPRSQPQTSRRTPAATPRQQPAATRQPPRQQPAQRQPSQPTQPAPPRSTGGGLTGSGLGAGVFR
ncbi:hypothetical protein [Paracoccus pacificus]|uniref:Peptidoglycan binding domain-containing protein n=1 Tax=Paracoccus pacificus TaxID=1463598 RepID=A0ABW4R785_9RHOB